MWWVYYLVPSGEILQRHRDRASIWGYVQILIVTSIVATGAGLRVAAAFIEHKAHLTVVGAVLAVALPVVGFLGLLHALYYYLVRRFRTLDAWLLITSNGAAVIAVIAASAGLSMAACLVILTLAPTVTVVAFEVLGSTQLSQIRTNRSCAPQLIRHFATGCASMA
jgi:hypothetical protein